MRLNINLASRKYEDVRKFFVGWGVTLIALGVCTLLLATMAGINYASTAKATKDIRALETKEAALQKERDTLVERERQNREITEQKRFWNSQIARRIFSWTQLLNDLQKMMPARSRLASVQPELTPDHRLKLKLLIEGESRPSARELKEKMEGSECFRSSKILSETTQKDTKTNVQTYKFEIEADYAPCASHGQSSAREGL
jgi:Tfp pilus assembly protein PilN